MRIFSLIVLVFFLIWPKYIGVQIGGMKIGYYILVCLVFYGIVLMAYFGGGSKGKYPRSVKHATALLVTLIAYEFIVTLLGISDGGLQIWLRELIGLKLLFILGIYLSVRGVEFYNVQVLLISCLLIAGAIGIVDSILQVPVVGIFSSFFIDSSLQDGVIQSIIAEKIRDDSYRAQSVYDHPITFSIVMSFAVVIVLSLVGRVKGVYTVLLLFFFAYVGSLTGSRTWVVVFTTAVVSYGAYYAFNIFRSTANRIFARLFLFVGLIFVLILSLPFILTLVEGRDYLENASSLLRAEMWANGLPHIYSNPLFGYGYGSDTILAGIQRYLVVTIDDSYLSFLLNFGLIGVALFIAFIFYVYLAISAIKFRCDSSVYRDVLIMETVWVSTLCVLLVGQKSNSISLFFGYFYFISGYVLMTVHKIRGSRVAI